MKKVTNQRSARTELRNGCSRNEVFISPKNYKSLRNKSDLQKDWFVECRFFDPKFSGKYPKGFQYRKRANYETLQERKEAVILLKELMENELDNKFYNPISKNYMRSEGNELHPKIDFKSAIENGMKKLSGSEKHLGDVKIAMNRFCKALDDMNYSFLATDEIKIWHIRNVFDYMNLQKTPNYFNKFRQYLSDLFKIFIQYNCAESNPMRDIPKAKIEPKFREVLSDYQLKYIDPYLKKNYYSFYRYRMIFGYSAGRTAEFFRIQKKHVNIEKQEFSVLIKKGPYQVWETKVIMLDAVPYWEEILELCNSPEDFIFAKGLVPGVKPIKPSQITKRWERLVKNSVKIKDENDEVVKVTADFYTLKHKLIEDLEELQSSTPIIPIGNPAQIMANHKSESTTGIYAHGRARRKNEALKKIKFG